MHSVGQRCVLFARVEDITPQKQPITVYVMGQPGSGKTSQAWVLRRALRGRPTRISGDFFKASHPDYYDLLRQEPRTAGERIRADYRAWQAMAEAAVRERRGDVTIEIAPGSAAGFVAGAMAYRRAGYRAELVVLAVRAADSRQGTAVRCADVNRLGGHGRFTTAQRHDHHSAVLADAVAAAEQEAVADSVMMWGRDGTVLYRNGLNPQGSWARPTGAVKALLAEQKRPYSSQEAARFWALQRRLRAVSTGNAGLPRLFRPSPTSNIARQLRKHDRCSGALGPLGSGPAQRGRALLEALENQSPSRGVDMTGSPGVAPARSRGTRCHGRQDGDATT